MCYSVSLLISYTGFNHLKLAVQLPPPPPNFYGLNVFPPQIQQAPGPNFGETGNPMCVCVWGGGGTLIISSYVGLDPASTVYPPKIPGISRTPKKY